MEFHSPRMTNEPCGNISCRRFRSSGWIVFLACLVSGSVLYGATARPDLPAPAARKVDFAKDIEPIFAKSCYSCHGEQKQKNGYRLDVKSIALKGGEHHAPDIIPGKSAESPLIQVVSGLNNEIIMPANGGRLTPAQISLLRGWT